MYEYDLFAVICHEGQIDNGHYTNFARFQDEVSSTYLEAKVVVLMHILFSGIGSMMTSKSSLHVLLHLLSLNARVTPATLGQCLKASAYMLFYVKRHLDYKPYVTPSYVVTRETELAKERQREKDKEQERMREVEDALLATV